MGEYGSLIFSLLGVVAVLAVTYFGSRWLTKRYSASPGGRKMRIIDRTVLGKDKSIVLADICGSKYVIGVSAQQITLLKELGEIPEEETQPARPDFASIFGENLKKQFNISRSFLSKHQD